MPHVSIVPSTTSRVVALALWAALFVAGLVAAPAHAQAAPAAAAGDVQVERSPFRCDAKDASLWMEMKESGWVGYGETWNMMTCLDDHGRDIYFDGATKYWKDMRPTGWRRQHLIKPIDAAFYSTALPATVGIVMGGSVLVAFLMWLFSLRRRRGPIDHTCPCCNTVVPVPADEFMGMFCPRCGKVSFYIVRDGKELRSEAKIL